MAKPAAETTPVSTSTRRTPTRAASLAPNAPAVKPITPCGAIASPVISGESLSTCWKYSDSTSISPPFQRPSRRLSVPAVRSAGLCISAAGSRGSLWRRSATTNAAVHAAKSTSDPTISGDRQPLTLACDTANTRVAIAALMSSAPRTSRRCALAGPRESARSRGARATASRPTGTFTRNTARQLVY
jgi:hypothetical protein